MPVNNTSGITGTLHVLLTDENGKVKYEETIHNKITTVGDEYYAKMSCAGIDGNSAPDLVDGMKLGTDTATAAAKSSTGSFIASSDYISGSNNAFTSVTPAAVGTDTGWKITYVADWAAGDATATIGEAHICTDQATDDTSTNGADAVISRALLSSAVTKASGDTLKLTWTHTFLGS